MVLSPVSSSHPGKVRDRHSVDRPRPRQGGEETGKHIPAWWGLLGADAQEESTSDHASERGDVAPRIRGSDLVAPQPDQGAEHRHKQLSDDELHDRIKRQKWRTEGHVAFCRCMPPRAAITSSNPESF
jgi:hypothetical protein